MAERSKHLADFHIAGMRFWDGALAIDKLKPGKKLDLVAEPDNPHDSNAVAIYRKGIKLGYIPRDSNAFIAQLLFFGHKDVVECRVLCVNPEAEPWNQVRVGLYMTDKTGKNPRQ
ncbi:MAG: HIRAN domain-containing protein [Slackia sp.]|nr:HIRAN domain-containing protein [Slackia sp.]